MTLMVKIDCADRRNFKNKPKSTFSRVDTWPQLSIFFILKQKFMNVFTISYSKNVAKIEIRKRACSERFSSIE